MPFKTTNVSGDAKVESPVATERTMRTELKNLTPNDGGVVGVIGKPREEEVAMPAIEHLSDTEKRDKASLQAFLIKHVIPPELSQVHPNPVRDKMSMIRKVGRLTYDELKRIWPYDVVQGLEDDQSAELQARYKDVSP